MTLIVEFQKSILLLLLLFGIGCSPSYLVTADSLQLAEARAAQGKSIDSIPAVRESDRVSTRLRYGTFGAPEEYPSPGIVRVRGPGSRSAVWQSGMIITLSGLLLAGVGAGWAVGSVSDFGSSNNLRAAGLYIGASLSVSGDIMFLLVGPSLWIAGARKRPQETSP